MGSKYSHVFAPIEIRGICPRVNFPMAGDCLASGDMRNALHTAFDAARTYSLYK
ncbi:MAG: hypothetical protein GX254_04745 [Clostridiales bacterium]|jgi:hypothetical protein|nr:hypothetical protein [Clostridiales bacterium]